MLLNEKSNRIYYESLKDDEKDILRKSCTRYIKSEPSPGIFDQVYELCCTCSISIHKTEVTDSLIDLMDHLIQIKNSVNFRETDISMKDVELVSRSMDMNIKIKYEDIDTKILVDAFILYIRTYFGYFVDEEIMILLIICYTNSDTKKRTEIVNRIPFVMSAQYRLFFIKLKSLVGADHLNLKNISANLIKCKRREIEINEDICCDVLNGILISDFMEVPESYFNL
ncbi:hypothetical protein P3W45_001590 [Vairimorpha bombi]|jgi:hypothetical protein